MKKLLTIYIFFLSISAYAQIDNTMYFMDRLPQANYINSSTFPDCKFFIGGSMAFGINSHFDYNDFFFKGTFEYSDSIITPLHPYANQQKFLNKVKTMNYISTDVDMSLLYFGFRQKENYWSFDISGKMFSQIGIPGNLIKFPILGNGEVRDADFTGLHANLFVYHQVAIGYRRKINRYFNVGGSLKYLSGIANYYTSSSDLVLKTANKTNFISTSSNYAIHTNAPIEVVLDEDGYVETIEFLEFSDDISQEINKNILFTGNRGFAIDLGISKEWNSELTYYLNIEDLGYIRWKTHTHNFSLIGDESNEGGFEYKGVEMNDLNFSDTEVFPNMDTLLSKFSFNYNTDSYLTPLPFKIYAGAKYKLNPKLHLGAVSRFEKLSYGIRPSITTSCNYRPGKFGSFTLSYSYINRNFNNFGIGFTLRLGPMQMYLISDNLLGSALFPHNTRSMSMRMGCNLVFGYLQGEKPKRALPLFNTSATATARKVPKMGQVNKYSVKKTPTKKYKAIGAPEN